MAQALFVAGIVLGEKGKFGDTPTTEKEQPAGNSITSQPLVLQQTPGYSHSAFKTKKVRDPSCRESCSPPGGVEGGRGCPVNSPAG